jgi:cytochrome P450
MQAGDAILVVLAAANRDPAANPDPARFDAGRRDRRSFTFGLGGHACPGASLALTIATGAAESLLASGLDPTALGRPTRYRPSVNTRIPLWS